LFECVINVSEGRRGAVLDLLARSAGPSLRDRHADPVHNRSVFTLIDDREKLRRNVHSLVVATMKQLDLRDHVGVHPRFGVLDVVPYVALDPKRADVAIGLRDETAAWVASTFEVPVFLYGKLADGTIRTLPEVRKRAFRTLAPDFGPPEASARRGASAVGARGVLVAWNLWVRGISLGEGREIARALRRAEVRALAFSLPPYVQISVNLVEPNVVGPSVVYDQVKGLLRDGEIEHTELVGLVPESVLRTTDPARWEQLDLSDDKTIEARLG